MLSFGPGGPLHRDDLHLPRRATGNQGSADARSRVAANGLVRKLEGSRGWGPVAPFWRPTLASPGFLGFGLPPTIPDWGGMLSREGRKFMEQAPWLALWPGLCLTITVYSLNMFGDAVRDLLDPRLRGGGSRLGA